MSQPPKLRNDCFALPQGVDWTPVDTALARLEERLHPVVGIETVALGQAGGRVLQADVTARATNPPFANSAVDGYGFAFSSLGAGDVNRLPIIAGRAAAGEPFDGVVPDGHAVRILTGAAVPKGVDTVILQEDVTVDADEIVFRSGLKAGANTRHAGEDFGDGDMLLSKGAVVRSPDIALLAAAGIDALSVYERLRVGVMSTGDELIEIGDPQNTGQIYDANRPMLLDLAARWGCEAVDLGHMPDDADQIEAALDKAAASVDVILTSGGASAGDEDYVSQLLSTKGDLSTWRVAIKPGRPLAMALWEGTPVFGFPGNPVAAFVCALIFARPAVQALSGQGWSTPQGFKVPAAFAKSKKAGRREYLRARLDADGKVETFKSEGSGRISGLSWATGLVALDDHAYDVAKGDLVTYYPYASFGL